jgi:hypothetical protein
MEGVYDYIWYVFVINNCVISVGYYVIALIISWLFTFDRYW